MPGSILISGRGSTSPDRHVTFGNIERYDILTSNEIKDNQVKRQYGGTLITPSGNYPMTRLDIRIRKAIILGFNYLPGDTVAYNEIIEFLLEFGVIVNKKNCNQRQITAIIQASYPKVIIKPSAKHSVIFVNLENRSDDVIKEELIRVTTEPIIDPVEQSNLCVMEWIKSETEKFNDFVYGEDEELKSIEEKSKFKQMTSGDDHPRKTRYSGPRPLDTSSPMVINGATKIPLESERVDKSSSDNTEELIHPPEMEKLPDLISNVNDVKQVDKHIPKSLSVSDLNDTQDHSKSMTKLKRTRSFQRSTDRNYVGSIRDRFRTLIDPKDDEIETDQVKPIDPKSINKFNKYETNSAIEQMKKREKYISSSQPSNVISNNTKSEQNVWRKPSIQPAQSKLSECNSNSTASTSTPTNSKFSSISNLHESRETSTPVRRTSSFRGNCRQNNEQQEYRSPQKFEGNEKCKDVLRKNSFRENKTSMLRINGPNVQTRFSSSNDLSASKSPYRRSYHTEKDQVSGSTPNLSNDTSKYSLAFSRRFSNSSNLASGKDTNTNTPVIRSNSTRSLTKSRSDMKNLYCDRSTDRNSVRVKSSTNSSAVSSNSKNNNFYKIACNERLKAASSGKKNSLQKLSERDSVKRRNRRESVETTSITSSIASSMCSSPDLISDVDLQVLDLSHQEEEHQSKEEKDIIRIAKAFQKAKMQTETINDNIATFMKKVATEDLELSHNNRLNLDDLYKHIRERMILAKDEIFEGSRSEFTVEMSQYFDLLFTSLATHLDRVGCEIITNHATGERSCFLTHVRLVDASPDDTLEEETSYV